MVKSRESECVRERRERDGVLLFANMYAWDADVGGDRSHFLLGHVRVRERERVNIPRRRERERACKPTLLQISLLRASNAIRAFTAIVSSPKFLFKFQAKRVTASAAATAARAAVSLPFDYACESVCECAQQRPELNSSFDYACLGGRQQPQLGFSEGRESCSEFPWAFGIFCTTVCTAAYHCRLASLLEAIYIQWMMLKPTERVGEES